MMNTLRYKAKAILIWVVPAIIISFMIAIFAVWGAKSSFDSGNGNPDVLALIGKQPVTYTELSQVWSNKRDEIYASGRTVSEAEEKTIKKELLDQLIENKVLLNYAKKMRIMASNEEVGESIMQIRAFAGQDGRFDKNRYYQILTSQRISIPEFEEGQRTQIVMQKLRNLIWMDIKATDDELRMYYIKRNRTLTADYAFFGYKNYLKELTITEDKMKDYYSVNKKNYEKPERVKASHILIMADASPTSPSGRTDEQAKKLADELVTKARAGASFSDLAKQYSQDPGSGSKGGDLGYFGKGQMVAEFEKAAFALKIGEISGVVKSQFGYHIIKVTGKEAGYEPTFDKERAKIKEELEKQEGMKVAKSRCESFLADIKTGAEFKAAAAKYGASIRQASGFNKDSKLSGIDTENFKDEALNMTVGETSGMISGEAAYYVIKLASEKQPAFDETKFRKEYNELDTMYKEIKFAQIYKDTVEALKTEAKVKYFEGNL
ncbi:MAG: Foldase protein PrsA 1 precursor [Candidatus Aerophobetes bacterium ADurb.Bin490]|nr:MAG: Foldase protein PrsA 1 precursor [Candidatus Aerophobetes bacterium ADurb.Bin490]